MTSTEGSTTREKIVSLSPVSARFSRAAKSESIRDALSLSVIGSLLRTAGEHRHVPRETLCTYPERLPHGGIDVGHRRQILHRHSASEGKSRLVDDVGTAVGAEVDANNPHRPLLGDDGDDPRRVTGDMGLRNLRHRDGVGYGLHS